MANKQLIADIYCRVSTEEQEDNTSFERQEQNCRELAIQRGIIVRKVWHETFTGTLYRERKDLSQMRKAYQNGKGEINCVLVNTIDRLTRENEHFYVLYEEMKHEGVTLLSPKEQIDDTPQGKFYRMFLSLMSEMERLKIVDRVTTGRRDKALVRGQLLPGSKPLYGYKWHLEETKKHGVIVMEKVRYDINEQEAVIVRRVFILYVVDGVSQREICRILTEEGIPSPRGKSHWGEETIRRMLTNEFYTGRAKAFRTTLTTKERLNGHGAKKRPLEEQITLPDGVVPRIVDDEMFEAAQRRIEVNKQDAVRNNPDAQAFLLRSGFVICGYCGRKCEVKKLAPNQRYRQTRYVYQCSTSGSHPHIKRCNSPHMKASALDELIWEQLEDLADTSDYVSQKVKEIMKYDTFKHEAIAIERARAKLIGQKNQFMEDLRSGSLRGAARDMILEEITAIGEKLERLDHELLLVQNTQVSYEAVKRECELIETWCKTIRSEREALTYEQKRAFMRLLGVQVHLYRENDQNHPDRYNIKVHLPQIAPLMLPEKRVEEDAVATHTFYG